MSNKSLNAILIASISILSVAVITLTVLIIREGKPVQYDSLYESQEEEENVDLGNTDFQEQTTEADEPEKVQTARMEWYMILLKKVPHLNL